MNPLAKPIHLLASTVALAALLGALLAAPGAAVAQATPAAPTAPAAPAAPAADAPPQIFGFEFTGFADIGYTSFSTGKGSFISGFNARTFDFDDGVVAIQNVDLQLAKMPEKGLGGLINLTLGKDADTIAAYGTIDRDKGPANGADKFGDVTQAFLAYHADAFRVHVGKYVTHAGAEVIKSRDDPNFSRSILFGFAIPFTHTGLRAWYKASDALTLLVGANQGWDTIENKNDALSFEAGWEWAPSKAFSLLGTLHSGPEKVYNYPQATLKASPKGTRNLLDVVGTYNATDSLTFILNFDYGTQEKVALLDGTQGTATWSGWAGYVNYTLSDSWRLSVRGEMFDDPDAYRTAAEPGKTKGPQWTEGTVTLAWTAIKKLELRGEVRSDSASQKIFRDKDAAKALASMTSAGVEAIYKF